MKATFRTGCINAVLRVRLQPCLWKPHKTWGLLAPEGCFLTRFGYS